METKQFQNLLESIINLNEDHMKGKTVIVNGKRGVVGKEVSKDGQTEGDEFYRVKFEDGSVKDIPARDMEMAGNTKNKKQPSENEAEDIANEDVELDEVVQQWAHDNSGQKVGYTNKKLSDKHVSKLRKKYSSGSVEKDNDGNHVVYTGKYRKESVELEEKKKKKGKHDCATHVEHAQYGEGQCIHSKHATPDENGQIAWYDVMFEHGIEKGVPTDSLKILVSEMHEDHEPEEGENLDELKKSTLGSYINKAATGIKKSEYEAGRAGRRYDDAHSRMSSSKPEVRKLGLQAKGQAVQDYRAAERTTKKRQSGIQRAVKKLGEASSMVYGKYKAQNTGKQDRHGFDKYDISKGNKVISRGKTERQSKQKLDRVRQLQQKKANIKLKLGEGSLGYQKALRSKGKEKEGMRSGNKRERAMDFRRYEDERKKSNKRTHTEDYQCPKEMKKQNMKGAGIGIPAINNGVFGTKGFAKKAKKAIKEDMSKYDSYDKWRSAGFPTKKKKPMVKVKTNKEIGWEMRDGATGKVIKKGGPPVPKR